jgi:hypothetical protein
MLNASSVFMAGTNIFPQRTLETREIRRDDPRHQLVENALLQLPVTSVDEHVVHPLHKAVTLSEVILLFVETFLITSITVVAITSASAARMFSYRFADPSLAASMPVPFAAKPRSRASPRVRLRCAPRPKWGSPAPCAQSTGEDFPESAVFPTATSVAKTA